MLINQKLYECMLPAASGVTVEQVTVGLGYTAVTTSDGEIGITDSQQALKFIRHGGGAWSLKHVSRKVYCLVEAD